MSENSPTHHENRKRRLDSDGDENSGSDGTVEVDESQCPESEEGGRKLSNNQDRKRPATDVKEALFPYKLYEILQCEDYKEMLSWLPHGRSWKILDSEALARIILPKHFRHGKFSSFKRQMSGWGFRRGIKVNEYNEYNHQMFIRDEPELLSKMKRRKQKRKDKVKTYTASKNNAQDSKMPATRSVPDYATSSNVAMGNTTLELSSLNDFNNANAGIHADNIGSGSAVPLENPMIGNINQNLSLSELSALYASANQHALYSHLYNPLNVQGGGLLDAPQNYETSFFPRQQNNLTSDLRLRMALQSHVELNNIHLSDYISRLVHNPILETGTGQSARFSLHGNSWQDSSSAPSLNVTLNNMNQLGQFTSLHEQRYDANLLATLRSNSTSLLHNSDCIRHGQNVTNLQSNNLPTINTTSGIQGQDNLDFNATLELLRRSGLSMPPSKQNNPSNSQR